MFRSFSRKIEFNLRKLKLFFFFFLLASSMLSDNISITSDRLEVSFTGTNPEFVFSQNVQIRAPSFFARCTQAHVTTSSEIQQLACELGNIKHVEITGPIHFVQGERSCDADYAEIIPPESTIILKGNANVNDSIGSISAAEIRVNYATQSIDISGTTQLPVQVTVDSTKKNSSAPEQFSDNYVCIPQHKTTSKFTVTPSRIPYAR